MTAAMEDRFIGERLLHSQKLLHEIVAISSGDLFCDGFDECIQGSISAIQELVGPLSSANLGQNNDSARHQYHNVSTSPTNPQMLTLSGFRAIQDMLKRNKTNPMCCGCPQLRLETQVSAEGWEELSDVCFVLDNTPKSGWRKEIRLQISGKSVGSLDVAYVHCPIGGYEQRFNSRDELDRAHLEVGRFDFQPTFCVCQQSDSSTSEDDSSERSSDSADQNYHSSSNTRSGHSLDKFEDLASREHALDTFVECSFGRCGCNGWVHPRCVGLGLRTGSEMESQRRLLCPLCSCFLAATDQLHRFPRPTFQHLRQLTTSFRAVLVPMPLRTGRQDVSMMGCIEENNIPHRVHGIEGVSRRAVLLHDKQLAQDYLRTALRLSALQHLRGGAQKEEGEVLRRDLFLVDAAPRSTSADADEEVEEVQRDVPEQRGAQGPLRLRRVRLQESGLWLGVSGGCVHSLGADEEVPQSEEPTGVEEVAGLIRSRLKRLRPSDDSEQMPALPRRCDEEARRAVCGRMVRVSLRKRNTSSAAPPRVALGALWAPPQLLPASVSLLCGGAMPRWPYTESLLFTQTLEQTGSGSGSLVQELCGSGALCEWCLLPRDASSAAPPRLHGHCQQTLRRGRFVTAAQPRPGRVWATVLGLDPKSNPDSQTLGKKQQRAESEEAEEAVPTVCDLCALDGGLLLRVSMHPDSVCVTQPLNDPESVGLGEWRAHMPCLDHLLASSLLTPLPQNTSSTLESGESGSSSTPRSLFDALHRGQRGSDGRRCGLCLGERGLLLRCAARGCAVAGHALCLSRRVRAGGGFLSLDCAGMVYLCPLHHPAAV